jgi:hypothetical protein
MKNLCLPLTLVALLSFNNLRALPNQPEQYKQHMMHRSAHEKNKCIDGNLRVKGDLSVGGDIRAQSDLTVCGDLGEGKNYLNPGHRSLSCSW